jgi:energy-coupling factor transport system ATP-binding protein
MPVEPLPIQVDHLYYTYPAGVEALRGVALQIAPGEQVAIIGQNGSGKTTLVKHFNGLLRPSRGTVRIGDWPTHEHSVAQLAGRVGYVFQNPDDQLFKTRVEDEVRVGPANLHLPPDQVDRQVQHALALLGLVDKAAQHPYDLTPAWRKRVAIAAVVAMGTPILVLDEPTTGQDHAAVQELGRVLAALRSEGHTIITISHDIDFVAAHFDRIVVMGQGQVLLDGTPGEVFAQPGLLARTYVEPPQIARLADRLEVGRGIYTVERLLDALAVRRAGSAQEHEPLGDGSRPAAGDEPV